MTDAQYVLVVGEKVVELIATGNLVVFVAEADGVNAFALMLKPFLLV